MPPKKIKPNEKCPCGSGKKHKKCCMIAEQLKCDQLLIMKNEITTLIDLMDDLALTNTTTTAAAATVTSASNRRSCLHGSTSDHFSDGRAYRDTVQDYVSLSKEDRAKFHDDDDDHLEYFTDLSSAQYIVALCTSWYLKINGTTPELKDLVLLAVRIKCLLFPLYSEEEDEKPDFAKYDRYNRAIMNNDDRGVINWLSKKLSPTMIV